MTTTAGPPSPSATRRLIDAREVAGLLGCSSRTVFRLADAGQIPWGVKVGSLRRWDLRKIEYFIAGGCLPVRAGSR